MRGYNGENERFCEKNKEDSRCRNIIQRQQLELQHKGQHTNTSSTNTLSPPNNVLLDNTIALECNCLDIVEEIKAIERTKKRVGSET